MNNTAISYNLKPCPFCGGKPNGIKQISINHGMDGAFLNWIIGCSECGANIESAADSFYGREYDSTPGTIVSKWNRRVGL